MRGTHQYWVRNVSLSLRITACMAGFNAKQTSHFIIQIALQHASIQATCATFTVIQPLQKSRHSYFLLFMEQRRTNCWAYLLWRTGGWWHLNLGEGALGNDWGGMVSNTSNAWFVSVWCHSICSIVAIIMRLPSAASYAVLSANLTSH